MANIAKKFKYDMIRWDTKIDNTYDNEKYLLEEFKKILDISDVEMREKKQIYFKSKIREFKIKTIFDEK